MVVMMDVVEVQLVMGGYGWYIWCGGDYDDSCGAADVSPAGSSVRGLKGEDQWKFDGWWGKFALLVSFYLTAHYCNRILLPIALHLSLVY